MTKQATVTLDCGILLLDNLPEPYTSLDVGYFEPQIMIYIDGELTYKLEQAQIGKRLEVRVKGGATPGGIIPFSASLKANLLRLSKLYEGLDTPAVRVGAFETIINFNSGHFRCSGVKHRRFYVRKGTVDLERRTFGPIAHDVVAEYDLGDDGVIMLSDGAQVIWSSSDVSEVKRRIDIEILADDSTATRFFDEALELEPDGMRFIPNQGQPPPVGSP